MADNDIATQWLSFDDSRRKELLGKMSPEQKRSLRVALEQHKDIHLPATATTEQKPGFFSRTMQGLGLPSTREELKAMLPSSKMDVATDLLLPDQKLGMKVAEGFYRGLGETGKSAGKEIHEAGSNIASGGPVGANLGKALSGVSEFALRGVLAPVGGGAVQAWGEDISQKNFSGAAGDALAVLLNAAALKGAKPKSLAGKAESVAAVADLSKGGRDLHTVLPVIERASKAGPPKTVGELLDTVNKAKDNMNMQSGLAMNKIKGHKLVPIGISNRLRSRITPDMKMTAEGRRVETMLKDAATDFEKPWTFEQLDALRMRWNSEIGGFHKMSPAERSTFLKANPDVAVQVEVVDGVRDVVYPAMDKAAGKPAGFFANLKDRQSTLIDLQKNLESQADTLATETMKIKGTPRFGSKNVSAYMAGTRTAHPGISVHRLHEVISRPNPEALANKSVRRAFTGRPTSKAAIYSLPLRQLLIQSGQRPPEQKKKPAEQIKDLHAIQQSHSSNPGMPIGEEQ